MAKKIKEKKPITIEGPFVKQTFIRFSMANDYSQIEAEEKWQKLIRSGKIVKCGFVGLMPEIQSYTFNK